jgi:Major Facilitator Superfamily.
MKKENYQNTIYACFIGYIIQAVVNNFVPLLFLTFRNEFNIPLSEITLLITFNFGIQLVVDLVSAVFVDKIGYRASMTIAHLFSAIGLILLAVLPGRIDAFTGLLISVMLYAIGGGLMEVLVSPIVEACPTDNKETAMSLLHSFYCWGQVGVVLLSTIFFAVFGISNWRILALIWAVLPIANMIAFLRVPIPSLQADGEKGLGWKELLSNGLFWVLMLMMFSAGASEQAVSQWASALAESGMGVSKTVGDLLGPMLFAIMMGTSRTIFARHGEKISLRNFMKFSIGLYMIGIAFIVFVPIPLLSLLGCGICGFAVGIFWPGSFSIGAAGIKRGGTLMFALFALAGDLGCSGGPTLTGFVASMFGDNLKMGIFSAVIFPVFMGLSLYLEHRKRNSA